MTIIGNIFLGILVLISLVAMNAVFGKTPPTTGDAAVGYPWSIILINMVMLACLVVITAIVMSRGGFNWVSSSAGLRYLLVWSGLLAMVATNAFSALYKYESGPVPGLLKVFSSFVPALLPLIWIVSAAILLNEGLKTSAPAMLYKAPLTLGLIIGVLGILSVFSGAIQQSNRNAQAAVKELSEREKRSRADHFDRIRETNALEGFSNILVFTDHYHDQDVRDSAVAKIKTNPKWQEELLRLLTREKLAADAFVFLASNDVDDKTLFAPAIEQGIRSVASNIRSSIRNASHSSHFYADQFSYEIERVIKTVEKYKDSGVDYRPAMQELRAALDEPSEYKTIKFDIARKLDKWI